MNWKALVAVVVVLATLGFLAMTEQGRQYAIFLGKGLGSIVGSVFKVSPTESFNFELKLNKEDIYGQSFSLSSSDLIIYGQGESIKMDDKVWTLRTGEIEMEMSGDGDFVLTVDGKARLNVNAQTLRFRDSSTSDMTKVEAEITPVAFSLSNIKNDKLDLASVTGMISKVFGSTPMTTPLTKNSLEIDNFSGSINLENQTVTLSGTATGIKIDGNSI